MSGRQTRQNRPSTRTQQTHRSQNLSLYSESLLDPLQVKPGFRRRGLIPTRTEYAEEGKWRKATRVGVGLCESCRGTVVHGCSTVDHIGRTCPANRQQARATVCLRFVLKVSHVRREGLLIGSFLRWNNRSVGHFSCLARMVVLRLFLGGGSRRKMLPNSVS